MLVAKLNWAFPRMYQTEEDCCYSYLFQNRFKKISRDMFILVVHNPDPSWVRIEANKTCVEDDLPQTVAKILYRIEGLFSFNYRSRPNKIPVVHANPIISPRVFPNAVFVNLSNKHEAKTNYVYQIEDKEVLGYTSIHFVNNLGPLKAGTPEHPIVLFRNKLVGVIPYHAYISRVKLDTEGKEIHELSRFRVSEEGLTHVMNKEGVPLSSEEPARV